MQISQFNSPNLNNKAVSVWDEHIWKWVVMGGRGGAIRTLTVPSHTERLVQLPSCFSLLFIYLFIFRNATVKLVFAFIFYFFLMNHLDETTNPCERPTSLPSRDG